MTHANIAAVASLAASIPTWSLSGGGRMPMLGMGGSNFTGWLPPAGDGPRMIQTFQYAPIAPPLLADAGPYQPIPLVLTDEG